MTVNRLFQDHMVLQREKPVAMWGEAAPGSTVTVTFMGKTASVVADESGGWRVILEPMETAWSETLLVECDTPDTGAGGAALTGGSCTQAGSALGGGAQAGGAYEWFEFHDVAVGEVWLAGGQSNMEFFMRYDADYLSEREDCADAAIRFFDYPEVSYEGQEDEFDYSEMAKWRVCDEANLEWFSAVAYYALKKLRHDLDVPVGIIGCNWGGTTAACWMPREYLARHGQVWLDEYDKGAAAVTDVEQYKKQLRAGLGSGRGRPFENPFDLIAMPGLTREKQLEFMKSFAEASMANGQFVDPVAAPGPCSFMRPGCLYECMLSHIAPYTVRGALWYQGESDSSHPDIYRYVLGDMVTAWRDLWKDDFPFIQAQLAPFGEWMMCEGSAYPAVRRAQEQLAREMPGVYMAATSDVGMLYDIHPKKKQPVGVRMALLAEKYVYGRDVLADSPRGTAFEQHGNELKVTFENAGTGLELRGAAVNALHVYGADGEIPVSAATVQGDRLTLTLGGAAGTAPFVEPVETNTPRTALGGVDDTSIAGGAGEAVPAVTRVEFANEAYYEVNLYNSAAIPAVPFVLE